MQLSAPKLCALLSASLFMNAPAAETPSLAERLGYQKEDRLLIINGDDAGMCHAANLATIESLEEGLMGCSTIMVPCPWFPEIAGYAREHPAKDFGVHLCHTAEWAKFRWGPVAPAEQALAEGRAQIKRALAAGIDVSHLDSHMGTLQLQPDYLKVYLQLAAEFNLPVRMASQETLAA